MQPDPAEAFAPVLASTDDGSLVRVEFEALPGPGHGPAGIATVQGVVVEVLKDSGDLDGIGRYFRSLRLRDGGGETPTDYRLDYRGVRSGECYVRQNAGRGRRRRPDPWGRRRRVYALEVEGEGITARRERPGHSFGSVPTDDDGHAGL